MDKLSLSPEERVMLMGDLEDLKEFEDNEPEYTQYSEAPKIIEESKKHKGRPLGISSLDTILGGVCSGELIIVTAPTGVGKTTLCQTVTWNLANQGHPSLWYTLEVTLENFLQPFITNDANATWEDGKEKLLKVSDYPIYFPKNVENLDFKTLKRAIKYAHAKFGVEHVFIDHLHYLLSSKELGASKSTSLFIGDKLRELRKIAHQTGVSIFLVAHLSKIPDGKPPTLNDMRDSSFVGQEADAVIVLWRERLKEPVSDFVEGVEVLETFSPIVHCQVEKARRTGRKGKIFLAFERGLYHEVDKKTKEEIENDKGIEIKQPTKQYESF